MSAADDYRGPDKIGYATFPNRGRAYHFECEGRQIEISASLGGRNLYVYVDGKQWKPDASAGEPC